MPRKFSIKSRSRAKADVDFLLHNGKYISSIEKLVDRRSRNDLVDIIQCMSSLYWSKYTIIGNHLRTIRKTHDEIANVQNLNDELKSENRNLAGEVAHLRETLAYTQNNLFEFEKRVHYHDENLDDVIRGTLDSMHNPQPLPSLYGALGRTFSHRPNE